MTKLLEMKDSLIRIYAKFDSYINMGLKFILALVMLLVIKNGVGYMDRIGSLPISLVLALICCLLPMSATLWVGALVVLLNLYALSIEVALVGAALFLAIYLIYFRFCPKDNVVALLTPILGRFGIPYVLPAVGGLLRPVYSALSIACGTVVYYFLDGVRQNASTVLAPVSGATSSERLKVLVGLLADNKEMYAVLAALVLSTLVIFFVRRLKIDYAWTIALFAGLIIQIVVYVVVSLALSVTPDILMLIIGSVLGGAIGTVLQFFCMNLDYERVERVQYEDDEYYYHVTAIPKRTVAAKEKQIKQFGNTGRMPRVSQTPTGDTTVLDRKALAQELDIDEDLLK